MKKKPCNNCPMRLDQTTPEWTPEQIERLLPIDDQIHIQMACHKSDEGKETPCVGWVISQLNNSVPNIGLRISILKGRTIPEDFDLSFPVHNSIESAFENKALIQSKEFKLDLNVSISID